MKLAHLKVKPLDNNPMQGFEVNPRPNKTICKIMSHIIIYTKELPITNQ